jgi:hypothetical protein
VVVFSSPSLTIVLYFPAKNYLPVSVQDSQTRL